MAGKHAERGILTQVHGIGPISEVTDCIIQAITSVYQVV